ncbi:hypothetical protein BHJ80_03005 [Escherichia coli]|nr:hypothetical protein BHJ80_03005 [Escherichia coli]
MNLPFAMSLTSLLIERLMCGQCIRKHHRMQSASYVVPITYMAASHLLQVLKYKDDVVNSEPKIRTAKLIEENRTSLKLDESTWAAIDMQAEKRGTDWKGWAKMVLKANPDSPAKRSVSCSTR